MNLLLSSLLGSGGTLYGLGGLQFTPGSERVSLSVGFGVRGARGSFEALVYPYSSQGNPRGSLWGLGASLSFGVGEELRAEAGLSAALLAGSVGGKLALEASAVPSVAVSCPSLRRGWSLKPWAGFGWPSGATGGLEALFALPSFAP